MGYRLITIALLVCVTVSSCGILDPSGEREEISDDDVYAAVYDGKRYPSDFFTDDDIRAVRTSYVGFNEYSDDYPLTGGRVVVRREPCASRPEQAIDRIAAYGLDAGEWQREEAAETYYEFTPKSGPTEEVRVHRCSYLKEMVHGYVREFGGVFVGVGPITERPITTETVRSLLDRAWFYRHYNVWGTFILERRVREAGPFVIYTAIEGQASFGDWGVCDHIRIWRSEFVVNKRSGVVSIRYSPEKQLEGRCN